MITFEKRLQEAHRLTQYYLQKYSNNKNRDDLSQVAKIGVWNAYQLYDEDKQTKVKSFERFASIHIKKQILLFLDGDHLIHIPANVIQANRKKELPIGYYVDSLDDLVYEDTKRSDTISIDETPVNENIELLNIAIDRLSDKDKEYIKLVMQYDFEWQTISEQLGVSRQAVFSKTQKIISKLKKKIK